MILKLKIIKKKEHNEFILQESKSKKEYSIILGFYGINNPEVNDTIFLDNSLLDSNNEWFSQPYTFEIINKKTNSKKDNMGLKKIDLALFISKNKKYILKRIYG